MTLRVVGPRLLVKVKKLKVEDLEKIEGSMFYRADVSSDKADQETAWQTQGEVVGIGSTAFKRKDGFCDGEPWCKVGDIVTYSRYGAIRTKTEDTEDHEIWILMDKDVLGVMEA